MNFGKEIKHLWNLDSGITFLNNGSFGASPKVVLDALNEWNAKMESEPVNFFMDNYFDLIRSTAAKLANFVGTYAENIVFVDNATTGVNTVLRSIQPRIGQGDVILTTNHVYPGVRNAIKHLCLLNNAEYLEVYTPFPVYDNNELIAAVEPHLTEKVKLAVFDHIVYSTGIIFPVNELCALCKQRNIKTLIDGAHAPGMINLNIEKIGCDWYTGNCHKWLFAPKGCAFLWSAPHLHELTYPLSISLFHNHGYNMEFDWTGTKNPGPFLALNQAIDFYDSFGRNNIRQYNHQLAINARNRLADALSLTIPTSDDMIGSLVTLQMIGNFKGTYDETVAMRKLFFYKHKIEIPFINFDDKLWFRFSSQIFNDMDDYETLLNAIIQERVNFE